MIRQDLNLFFQFIGEYLVKKTVNFGNSFEAIKDIIVSLLVIKRGRYSSSFLNTSFIIIVVTVLVAGPIIAENAPVISTDNYSSQYQAAIVSYNPYGGNLNTIVSIKSRDKIENYTVKGGDTLDLIAKKFDISVETIKWANDLKNDTIKPNQTLKIPPVTGVVHKVAPGDTVYSIAKKYKVEAQNIVNFPFNDYSDYDTFALTSGQVIYVPDGVIEVEKPVYQGPRFIANIQSGVKGSSSFIWPTSGVISQNPTWYHMALDIANPMGPAVVAADSGTVIYAGCLGWGYGCHVIVDHGNGFQTLYAHLSSYSPDVGASVSQGQYLGAMGSTGMSTGTHLHFEIRSGGALQNPWNYLK